MIRYYTIWYDTIWYGIIHYDIIWYDTIWSNTIWYHVIRFHTILSYSIQFNPSQCKDKVCKYKSALRLSSAYTCLSYANNCSDDSNIFQSFNLAVTTARTDRSHHHARNNEPVVRHMITGLHTYYNFDKNVSLWWRIDSILSDDTRQRSIIATQWGTWIEWRESHVLVDTGISKRTIISY